MIDFFSVIKKKTKKNNNHTTEMEKTETQIKNRISLLWQMAVLKMLLKCKAAPIQRISFCKMTELKSAT